MENFIFDIGGLIGLFLGSSILSVLELFVNVLKFIKRQAVKFVEWGKSGRVRQSVEPVNSPESTDKIIEIPSVEDESSERVEMPGQCESVETQRIFTISEGHISIHGPASIQEEELHVEDL